MSSNNDLILSLCMFQSSGHFDNICCVRLWANLFLFLSSYFIFCGFFFCLFVFLVYLSCICLFVVFLSACGHPVCNCDWVHVWLCRFLSFFLLLYLFRSPCSFMVMLCLCVCLSLCSFSPFSSLPVSILCVFSLSILALFACFRSFHALCVTVCWCSRVMSSSSVCVCVNRLTNADFK